MTSAGAGVKALAASAANRSGRHVQDHLGQQPGEARLEVDVAGQPAFLLGEGAREEVRHLLVGAILQQPGEKQVAGLQQGQVLSVLDLAGWAAAGRP